MASRNRFSYSSQNDNHHHVYSSFEERPQHLGLGTGGGMRRGSEQSCSRRMSEQANVYAVMDSRVGLDKSMARFDPRPIFGSESILNNHDQHLSDRSLTYHMGDLLSPVGVQHPPSIMRGSDNHALYENCDVIPHKQVRLADGHVRTKYQCGDDVNRGLLKIGVGMGGGLPIENVGTGGIVPGYNQYINLEEAQIACASASENMQSMGCSRKQLVREGRLVPVVAYGREDEATFVSPLSPRVIPVSPKRDDVVRMMSLRQEDVSPPMSTHRDVYDDILHMMSPHRDGLSPSIHHKNRDYADKELMERSRLSREEELMQCQDFPMSPRRGAGLTSTMNSKLGWDYQASISPTRLVIPVRHHPESPPMSPTWTDGAKAQSQWDLLPSNPAVWSGNDREPRMEYSKAYGVDILRGALTRQGDSYGIKMDLFGDDHRGLDQTWSLSRKGHEGDLFLRREDQDGILGPLIVSGQGQMRRHFDDQFRGYHAVNARPYPYNSVINQRVGLVTKYIERERAEKVAAERAAKERTNLTNRRQNRHAGNNKSIWENRQEKDVSSIVVISRNGDASDKNVGGSSERPLSLVEVIENATKQSNGEKMDDKTNANMDVNKSSIMGSSAGGTTTIENGNTTQESTAVGSGSTPSSTIVGTKSPEGPKVETEMITGYSQKKDARPSGNFRQNGVSNNSMNLNSQTNLKAGFKLGETHKASKRTSLVVEIERAKRSRMLTEQQRHFREMEETYYDANELSLVFPSRLNRSRSQYSQMTSGDLYPGRRYQGAKLDFGENLGRWPRRAKAIRD